MDLLTAAISAQHSPNFWPARNQTLLPINQATKMSCGWSVQERNSGLICAVSALVSTATFDAASGEIVCSENQTRGYIEKEVATRMEASGSLLSSVLLCWLAAAKVLYLDPVNLAASSRFNIGMTNRYNSCSCLISIYGARCWTRCVRVLCKRSLPGLIPSLILMNPLIIFNYDTITYVILIHRCPMDCPAILHTVCN